MDETELGRRSSPCPTAALMPSGNSGFSTKFAWVGDRSGVSRPINLGPVSNPSFEDRTMPLIGELARIDDDLRRANDGDCWHGPPLHGVLDGVVAAMAAPTHPQLVPSVWVLVHHLTAWVEVVSRRITEWVPITEPEAGDFPPVIGTGEAAWANALAGLDRQHRRLLDVVAGLDAEKLDEIVPGKPYPVAAMLHGTAPDNAYHAGQIALLKEFVA